MKTYSGLENIDFLNTHYKLKLKGVIDLGHPNFIYIIKTHDEVYGLKFLPTGKFEDSYEIYDRNELAAQLHSAVRCFILNEDLFIENHKITNVNGTTIPTINSNLFELKLKNYQMVLFAKKELIALLTKDNYCSIGDFRTYLAEEMDISLDDLIDKHKDIVDAIKDIALLRAKIEIEKHVKEAEKLKKELEEEKTKKIKEDLEK